MRIYQKRARLVMVLAAFSALAVLAAACTGGAGKGDRTDEITLVYPGPPDSMASVEAKTTQGHPVLRNIEEALLNRDKDTGELVGELATSWKQTKPDVWRFELRQGVKFHDGSPFNAEAAAFALNKMWDRDNVSVLTSFLGPDMTFTPVDDFVLEVKTKSPDPILPFRLYISPIFSMKAYKADPDSYYSVPVGTGPYKFVEWNRGQNVKVEANPDWWGIDSPDAGGKIVFKKATFEFREEDTVGTAMVDTGEAALARFISDEQCENLPVCKSVSGLETEYLRLDTMNPTMADQRVRKAIALALNLKQIYSTIRNGAADPAAQLVGPSVLGFNKSLKPYPFDPDEARRLLSEAKRDGIPVESELTLVARTDQMPHANEMVDAMVANLKTVGLNVKPKLMEQVAFEEMIRETGVPKNRGYIAFHRTGNELMDYDGTVVTTLLCNGAASTYCNKTVDRMQHESLPLQGEARDEAYQAIAKVVHDDVATIPLARPYFNYGVAKWLDWKPRVDGFVLLKEMSVKE